ncbi:hypothetical protein CR513_37015, partial [Mucuna pruriens]
MDNPKSIGLARLKLDYDIGFIKLGFKTIQLSPSLAKYNPSILSNMWDIVENRNYIPKKEDQNYLPIALWNDEQRTKYLLNSKARNFIIKYEKVNNCKSSKKIWDTLALAYKDFKIYIFVHQYELFKIEDHEPIDKILLRQWRPLVIVLRAFKDLKKLPMEELLGTLKLRENKGQKKGKSIALKGQKAPKGSLSKALKVKESSNEAYEKEGSDEDEFSFILGKIHSMWKKIGGSKWKKCQRSSPKKSKAKSQVVCYKCKKPRHFK